MIKTNVYFRASPFDPVKSPTVCCPLVLADCGRFRPTKSGRQRLTNVNYVLILFFYSLTSFMPLHYGNSVANVCVQSCKVYTFGRLMVNFVGGKKRLCYPFKVSPLRQAQDRLSVTFRVLIFDLRPTLNQHNFPRIAITRQCLDQRHIFQLALAGLDV